MVARHRVVDPRSCENESIVASESRNHDRSCHCQCSWMPKNRIHRRHRYPILGRMLDSFEWKRGNISKIGEDIEHDDYGTAYQQSTRQIASRIAHLAAKKCHIRPSSLGKDRTNHRFTKEQREGKAACNSETRLSGLR